MKTITLGPEGTFSEKTAIYYMPEGDIVLKNTIPEVIHEIEGSTVGILPIENNLSGVVEETMEALRKKEYYIVDIFSLPINHSLVGLGRMKEAEKIYCHPHTYNQCKETLRALGIGCQVVFTKSNGETKKILEEKKCPKILGIIPSHTTKNSSLPVLKENMEDRSENSTRFIVLKKS